MKILNYQSFSEAISGTEFIGHFGPNYGDQHIPTTISDRHTMALYSELTGRIYTYDDYNELYNRYLKVGGKPLHGFNKENLDTVLSYIS